MTCSISQYHLQIAALIDIHCALQDIVEIPIADDTLVSSPTEAGDHSRRVKELFPEPPASRIFAPTVRRCQPMFRSRLDNAHEDENPTIVRNRIFNPDHMRRREDEPQGYA